MGFLARLMFTEILFKIPLHLITNDSLHSISLILQGCVHVHQCSFCADRRSRYAKEKAHTGEGSHFFSCHGYKKVFSLSVSVFGNAVELDYMFPHNTNTTSG